MVTTTQAVATVDLLRWMPLIPLLASVVNIFSGSPGKKTAGLLACAAVAASFAIAGYIFGFSLPPACFAILSILGLIRAYFK
jgi:hypothetical protein